MHRASSNSPPRGGAVAVLAAFWLGATAGLASAEAEPQQGVTGGGVGAVAPSPSPAPATPAPPEAAGAARRLGLGGKYADTPVRQKQTTGESGKAASSDAAGGAAEAPAKPSTAREATRVGAALAAVLGLIFFLRWAARRLYKVPVTGRPSGAVQVLSRTVLSPKQQLVLLQVGKRVLVVADGGAQMSALCQITEPDEVASLVGQLRSEKESAATKAFGSVFGRMRKRFEAEPSEAEPQETSIEPPGKRGSRLDITDTEEPNVEAIDDTRQELNGLLEKVRLVSGQFRRT
jgi:flagellar biogenesis protein FliO